MSLLLKEASDVNVDFKMLFIVEATFFLSFVYTDTNQPKSFYG